MDLAEIRKKARLQNAATEADEQQSRLPAPLALDEGSPVATLESFWNCETGLTTASEEEYAQNLLLQKSGCEEQTVQWLTFFMGREEYALELSIVLELIRPRHLTELPQVPDYLLGIVSLRGVIVPVIDLRRRLSLAAAGDDSQQRVIVCTVAEQRIGLLVDKVGQVARINSDLLESPPLMLNAPAGDFVAGVGRLQGRMLILLDAEKVMAIEAPAPVVL
jgi:purine-binding chemotaxis protein CheW